LLKGTANGIWNERKYEPLKDILDPKKVVQNWISESFFAFFKAMGNLKAII